MSDTTTEVAASPIHLRSMAILLCAEWRANGFNGVRFSTAKVEEESLEDFGNELSQEMFDR